MLSSHEKCPICGEEMKHAKYLNKKCLALNDKIICYVESICNRVEDQEREYRRHLFFQVTTLYGELLMEKIQFPFDSIEIEVNYHKSQSIITYLPKPDPYRPNAVPVDKVEIPRLLVLDYPKLEKTINKAKTLVLFI